MEQRRMPWKKETLVILFNVQAIEISITNLYDPEKHVLIEEKSPQIFTVIKNKSRLIKLINIFENIIQSHKNTQQAHPIQPVIVSYSSKPSHTIRDKISKLSPSLAQEIIYFNLSPKQHSNVRPNRAFLSYNQPSKTHQIIYGQGYSQAKTKQQLRLAVQSVFGLNGLTQRIWIVQTQKGLKQQEKQLKKSPYKHLWTIQNFDSDTNQLTSLQQTYQNFLKFSHQPTQTIPKAQQKVPETLNSPHIQKSSKSQQSKEVSSTIDPTHFPLSQTLSPKSIIEDFLKSPKKSFTPIPKSAFRSPDSKEISSLIFKNMADHKLYLAKSSVPKDIGGLYSEELIQNRCFMSMIPNLFYFLNQEKGMYSLPMQKGYLMMKQSLLKQYETKKACALIKPYFEGLETLDKWANEFTSLITSEKYYFEGFGQLIFWTLVTNECFQTKTLLEQVTLVGLNESEVNKQSIPQQLPYLTGSTVNLAQFLFQFKPGSVGLLRTDYFQPFSLQKSAHFMPEESSQDISIHLTRKHKIFLKELNSSYLDKIYRLSVLFAGESTSETQFQNSIGEKLLRGLANHYKWQFDRNQIIDSLIKRSNILKQSIEKIFRTHQNTQKIQTYQNLSYQFVMELTNLNPLSLLLLLSRDYARFIKPTTVEQTSFYEMMPKNEQTLQNRYVVAVLQKTHSFQIHGSSPAVFSLSNWIRSLGNKYRFIEYISMLTHTKEDFILVSKKLKIMSTNEKMNGLLIVDHCELCEEIMDEAKSVRTVFVTRFKKGEHEMQTIFDQEADGKEEWYLKDSNDEFINFLMDVYEQEIEGNECLKDSKSKKTTNKFMFKKYRFVLETYVRIKSRLYGWKEESVINFLRLLHKNISQSKNRYKEILERYKQNGEWKYLYALPVEKHNQKITYTKDLQGFIDVLKFVEMVEGERRSYEEEMGMKGLERQRKRQKYEGSSKGQMLKIDEKSIQHINQWSEFIQQDIKECILDVLGRYIQPLQYLPANSYLSSQRVTDEFKLIVDVFKMIKRETSFSNRISFSQEQCFCHYPQQTIIRLGKLPVFGKSTKNQKEKEYYMVHTTEKALVYAAQNGLKIMKIQGKFINVKAWIQTQESHQIKLIAENSNHQNHFFTKKICQSPQKSINQFKNQTSYFQLQLALSESNQHTPNESNQLQFSFVKLNQNCSNKKQLISLKLKHSSIQENRIIHAQILSVQFKHKKEANFFILILTRTMAFIAEFSLKITDNSITVGNQDGFVDFSQLIDLKKPSLSHKSTQFVTMTEYNSQFSSKKLESLSQKTLSSSVIIKIQQSRTEIIQFQSCLPQTLHSPLISKIKSQNFISLSFLIESQSGNTQKLAEQKRIPQVLNIQMDLNFLQKTSEGQSLQPQFLEKSIQSNTIDITNLIDQKGEVKSTNGIYLHGISVNQTSMAIYYSLIDSSQSEKLISIPITFLNSANISFSKGSRVQETQAIVFKTHFLESLQYLQFTYFLHLTPDRMITLTDSYHEQHFWEKNTGKVDNLKSESEESELKYQEGFVRLWKLD